ncbi:phosphoadenosine phosphosulfate reductase [Frigidibacter sp. MR17.24]|uniref:phosphoadenosine phosphosulfate reductase n=1 Tax=Frigidibacter sp. MR17.24 TaxID=3127345 RepID=UPI003012D58F
MSSDARPLADRQAEKQAARQAEVLAALEAHGDEAGYFEPLGADHAALFTDEGTTLLVTFETFDACRRDGDGMPMGQKLAAAQGWSSLCLLAEGSTWFRDRAVFGFFDRQVDDAFFEDFDRVIFWGANMCGYAAAAFSVTAPGATVILAAPQATLDPVVTGWDNRFTDRRRMDFTSRYGYGPDMIEGAGPVYLIYDPRSAPDAMHAALFTKPFVHKLACPFLGPMPARILSEMSILEPLIVAAGREDFTPGVFWKLYRARHRCRPWLRRMTQWLDQRNRVFLAALATRAAAERVEDGQFVDRLAELEAMLEEAGGSLPPALPTPKPPPAL